MKRNLAGFAALVSLAVIYQVSFAQTKAAMSHKITSAQFDQMVKDLSNWGRWGKTDEKGADEVSIFPESL